MDDYLPQIRVSDFDIFDQRLWNDGVDLIEANFISKMKSVIAELKFQTPRGVGLITIGREFFNLVKKIRDSAIWCTINESKPSMFWANVLKDASMTMTVSLRNITGFSISFRPLLKKSGQKDMEDPVQDLQLPFQQEVLLQNACLVC